MNTRRLIAVMGALALAVVLLVAPLSAQGQARSAAAPAKDGKKAWTMPRMPDGHRRIVEITEVAGIEGGRILMQTLFRFQPAGERAGRHVAHHRPSATLAPCRDLA